MALTKAKKVELIDAYKSALKEAKSCVYVESRGVSVVKTESLRRKLYAESGRYSVVKKTLWDIAVKAEGVVGEKPLVPSELGVVWGADLLTPAKLANEFVKENKGQAKILGGIWDGQFKSAQEMVAIATIPPREVLLSQIAFLLKSPMQTFAIAVSEVAKKKA